MTNFPLLAFTKQDETTVSCSAGFRYKLFLEHHDVRYFKCTFADCKAKLSLKRDGCLEARLMEQHSHDVEEDEDISEASTVEVTSPPPPYQSMAELNLGQIFIEASLKVGAEESPKLRKSVDFDLNRPKLLSTIAEEIFYNDSAWNESRCFAMIEKKSENGEEFESVLAKYDATSCESGAKYRFVFYEAASVSKKFLSKFALELAAAEQQDEVEDEPPTNDKTVPRKVDLTKETPRMKGSDQKDTNGDCLIIIYCDGAVKFRKNSKFDLSDAPSMLTLAEGFCEIAYPAGDKQIIASFLKFHPTYDNFVNIDASERIENGKRYEIMFEECAEAITGHSHRTVVRRGAKKVESEPKQVGKATIDAVLKKGSKQSDSFQKIITVNPSERKPLMRYVMVIFYQDTAWSRSDCYVAIQKFDDEFQRFIGLKTDYDDVRVDVGDRFKVQVLDAAALSKNKIPKRAVLLERESDSDSSTSSSVDEPVQPQVLVEGVIKSDAECSSNFHQVLNLEGSPMSLLGVIEGIYHAHVQPIHPDVQFCATALQFNNVFGCRLAVSLEYSKVNVTDKQTYFIEFEKAKAALAQQQMEFSILIPKGMKRVEVEAAPVKEVQKTCKAFIEATYKNNSFKSPSFSKFLEFESGTPVTLIKSILTVFYKDTPWGKKKCFASVQMKSEGFEEFFDVTSKYETTLLEDKGKYRMIFYDAKAFSVEMLSKYCIALEGSGGDLEEAAEVMEDESAEEMEPEVREERNFVKFKGSLRRNIEMPNKKMPLEVVCPKRCTKAKRTWNCQKCGQQVFYAFSDHLHCGCGAYQKSDATFRCGNSGHGTTFASLQADAFRDLGECEEINIVLLGETGAGKSTWINAIFNYLQHATLDAAADNGTLEIPIPTHFVLEDTKIFVGKQNGNENQTPGASATQRPKSYTFMHGSRFYRFIDVPGIGDSRGVEQDRKNFEMIMQELYNHDRVHAIAILIPSDSSRLTIAMRYCINELLTHLHQDAAKNLIFCFTKARINFYKAGSTQEILRSYLKKFKQERSVEIALNERTMYYFDNESFKFLCALKNGIDMQEEKPEFVKSWDVSSKNTHNVLDYIAQLEPHLTRDMLSLNEAKRIILQLTPISAEITKNIQTNKRIIEAKKLELQEMKKQTVSLEEQLTIKQTTLKEEAIDFPKTVCAGRECIETLGIPGTSESQVLYKTICHDHCYLENIEPGKYPNPGLQGCAAMKGQMTCQQCGCSWDTHLHIRYHQTQETIDVPNKEVQKVLKGKNTDEVKVSDVIKGLEKRLDELNRKEKRIKTICAKFVAFLNQNAIAVINDAYGEYLEQSIKLAKNEVAVSGESSKKVDQLEKYLAEYKEEVAIIKDHIAKGTMSITVTSIEVMKEELKQMDELGDQFKNAMDAADKSQKTYKREDEIHLQGASGRFVESVKSVVDFAKDAIGWNTKKNKKGKEKQ